jgi:DNA-binding NarL/FixJ family response regulator
MVAKVLLADSSDVFRLYIRETLHGHPGFQVVAEATDGLTGVQKAEQLRPDVTLLEIDMPRMNGFEAARQIAAVSPESKIVFLTVRDSSAMVLHALELGALGYLIKSHLTTELLPALEAVVLGNIYVSRHAKLPDVSGPSVQ